MSAGLLAGKVALVTGARRGIGSGVVERFLLEGGRVVTTDLEAPDVDPECTDILSLRLDVAQFEQWQDAVQATLDRFGRLDILVGNAGLAIPGSIETIPIEQHHRMLEVNITGVFLGMRAVAPAMRAAGSGSIINISSIDGMIGSANMASYVATKFAVRGMSRSAALELGRDGIRVNSVCPGVIDTPLIAPIVEAELLDAIVGSQPIGRAGTVEEVADLVTFLASDRASYSTGGEYVVDGGRLAGAPLPPSQ